jgi:hypothetical protein
MHASSLPELGADGGQADVLATKVAPGLIQCIQQGFLLTSGPFLLAKSLARNVGHDLAVSSPLAGSPADLPEPPLPAAFFAHTAGACDRASQPKFRSSRPRILLVFCLANIVV